MLHRSAHLQEGIFTCQDGFSCSWRVDRSARAKNARIKVSAREGLVVVVPKNSRKDPQGLLEQNRSWVERAVHKTASERCIFLENASKPFPEELEFLTLGERWGVALSPTPASSVSARIKGDTLFLQGNIEDRELCDRALKRFTLARAKVGLPELLEATSEELQVPYASCRVSNAHTRWGSCSAQGVIMLSAQMAFITPELSYHVMCHELAHIAHLDHSAAYHARLAKLDPQAKEHAHSLKKATASIPYWMY